MDLNPNWLAAPIVVPLLAAALSLRFLRQGAARATVWQLRLATGGLMANLAVAVLLLRATLQGDRLVLQVGGWRAPFGITLLADGLSAMMLALTAILALATLLFAAGTLDDRARLNFYPLTCLLVMGVNGAFLAGDIFNLYVFFEVMLMASFALLTLGGQIGQINGGIRYVLLNLLASTLFLASAAIVYGTIGTLNLAHMAERMPLTPRLVQTLVAGLLMIAYGSKAGLFPLFVWLPVSYHTAHPAVTALFGGLLTKVGIYTLLRIFPLVFPSLLQEWQTLLLALAGLTMITGILGAMAVNTVRRVLSFQIISHVGYMLMGLGLAASTDSALALWGMTAAIVYLVHHMIAKTAILMAGGAAELEAGSGSLLRDRLAGLAPGRPFLAVLFFAAAMSLAGMPPFSGFVGKLVLLQAAAASRHWTIAAVSLGVSFLTLVSMIRLWQTAFWGSPSTAARPAIPPRLDARRRMLTIAPITLLVGFSLGIGLFAGAVFEAAGIAAQQVMDRDGYIEAVAPVSLPDPVEFGYAK